MKQSIELVKDSAGAPPVTGTTVDFTGPRQDSSGEGAASAFESWRKFELRRTHGQSQDDESGTAG